MTEQIQMITLITLIGNLFLQPLLQYLLHSKCDRIRCCGGCVDIHRVVEIDETTNSTGVNV